MDKEKFRAIYPIALFLSLFNKFLYISHDKDKQYNGRKDKAYINAGPLREFGAFAGVGFRNKIFPAPAVTAGTKQKITEAS